MKTARQLAFLLFFAAMPTVEGLAATVRDSLKAPIQPDAAPTNSHDKASRPHKAARPASKPVAKRAQALVKPNREDVPGQLSFSTFAVGGRVSEPRVTFELDPIPLEMVDEPFALDYQQRVRDSVVKKDLSL